MWMRPLSTNFFDGFCFDVYIFPGTLCDPDQFSGKYLSYQFNYEKTDSAGRNVGKLQIN